MYNLIACIEAIHVTKKPVNAYVKTGRRPGRPKKTEKIAKTNSTINQFFPPAKTGART
jgi:hypothetical protein